jgi:hypothetical protein
VIGDPTHPTTDDLFNAIDRYHRYRPLLAGNEFFYCGKKIILNTKKGLL